ncbi:hypothetical protein HUS70_09360 [Pandoraea nosoerga]|uniref:Uncharacterized protein n=1 Tax=Pandoraea nosoerga TaxID=2508296 RepID=A0A5E4X6D7_9BURK|nr:hypothetical protein [Pandoraea nosoerga]MBN4665108.1 hypothetical protein [Pandoraea nosoerga]MBN4675176.1 hypothetical protein [Pandoraea nosoerga]MBN4680851.1 hypothetical protein [Pandoraea nosoerga]MBN4744853.1 hypothetical protein [Pandoraea nosoerga]VVE31941.1 hypothetical protein PNO31109_03682 [Pandoraea nosoerga]
MTIAIAVQQIRQNIAAASAEGCGTLGALLRNTGYPATSAAAPHSVRRR